MDDDDVRRRIESGDLTDLGDLDLDESEREMVNGAALDYPEVVGFAFSTFGADVTGFQKIQPGVDLTQKFAPNPTYLSAVQYALHEGSKW